MKPFFIFLAIVVVPICICQAVDLRVPDQYATIQAAADAASAGDTILLADGIYTGEGNRDITITTSEITIRSEHGYQECIIDCQGSSQDNHRALLIDCMVTGIVTVRGIHFTNGYMSGGAAENFGGAIHINFGTSLELDQCLFTQNYAVSGGAVYNDTNGSLIITESQFTLNSSTSGGAIYGDEGSYTTIADSIFSQNTANTGGAVICFPISTYLLATNCQFNDCHATYGGAVALTAYSRDHREPGYYFFDQCQFTGCDADTGGAFHTYFSNPVVNNCIFDSNNVTVNGGAFNSECSHTELMNNVFCNNAADASGGAISVLGPHGSTVITNITSTGNSAGTGGAICFDSAGYAALSNCILFGDTAATGVELALLEDYQVSEVSIDFCNVQAGEAGVHMETGCVLNWGADNMDAIPMFVDGPLGAFYLSNTEAGQTETSPCVDTGSDPSEEVCFEPTSCLDTFTTRTDMEPDTDQVDIGFHYPIVACEHDCEPTQNGVVTAADSQLAFQIALGSVSVSYTVFCSADSSWDGEVTAMDAQIIFMVALGLCPCGDPIPLSL